MSDRYVNPSTGSDANDGLTALTAWQTVTKINSALAAGPLSLWRLNETGGNRAQDQSRLNNGTYSATGVTLNQAAISTGGTASALFDGTAGQVTCGDPATERPTTSWTIGLWMKSSDVSQIQKYLIHHSGEAYAILYNFVAGKVEFYPGGSSGSDPRPASAITVNDTLAHHIVYTYNSGTFCGYKDGVQIFSTAITFTLPGTGGVWYIASAGGANFFHGQLADVMVWNSALSAAEVLAQYQNGVRSSANPITRVLIDTSVSPLVVDVGLVAHGNSPGLEITSANAPTKALLRSWKTLSAGGFTKTGGQTNIYQTADTEATIVVKQDGVYLTHINGANFAAVAASMDATAGSFWTDGVTLYIHPTGNSNPASDGKVYKRSRLLTSGNDTCLTVYSDGAYIHYLDIEGSPLINTDGSPLGQAHYCVGCTIGIANTRFEDLTLTDGDKHHFVIVSGLANGTMAITRVTAEQGSPYLTGGQASNFNIYADVETGAPTGMTVTMSACSVIKNSALIGSTAGAVVRANPAINTHNSGSGTQYASVTINDCDFSGGILDQNNSGIAAWTINRSKFLSVSFKTLATMDRCKIVSGTIGATGGITMTNSIVVITATATPIVLAGSVDISGCSIDATGYSTGVTNAGVIDVSAASDIHFRGNAVLVPETAQDLLAFGNFDSGLIVSLDRNVYQLDTSLKIGNIGGSIKTWAQWQALGWDANGQQAASIDWDANYRPAAGSPLRRRGGSAVSGTLDYNGLFRPNPGDAGAVQGTTITPITPSAGLTNIFEPLAY